MVQGHGVFDAMSLGWTSAFAAASRVMMCASKSDPTKPAGCMPAVSIGPVVRLTIDRGS